MTYLIRIKGARQVAHLWNGDDTLCRMASTGGLTMRKYQVEHSRPPGSRLCHMCANTEASTIEHRVLADERRRSLELRDEVLAEKRGKRRASTMLYEQRKEGRRQAKKLRAPAADHTTPARATIVMNADERHALLKRLRDARRRKRWTNE